MAGRADAPPARYIPASAGRGVVAHFVPACWAALRAGGRLCTWTHPRPFSAPFPPTAPTSGAYPLTPDCPSCGAVAPQTNRGIMCHGLGGQGAWQPSLRSGRLRRPARAEWDNSRRRTPCPQCLDTTSKAGGSLLVVMSYSVCVRLLGWMLPASTSQQTLSVSHGGRRADSVASFFRRSGFHSPAPAGAQVFALFPQGLEPSTHSALIHSAPQTARRAQPATGNGCPIARVDSLRCPLRIRHRGTNF